MINETAEKNVHLVLKFSAPELQGMPEFFLPTASLASVLCVSYLDLETASRRAQQTV